MVLCCESAPFHLMSMDNEKQKRCINIDWLEVYCLENAQLYPCDANYFRRAGYLVRERPYGTRVYTEMFEILNDNNEPIMEVRRNPASGDSSFSGLVPESCHLRMPNWMLYQGNPVAFMMEFMLKHDYIFKRIFRIDICYDFTDFDSGDKPQKFVKRYLKGEYRKINQCFLSAHGEDYWNDCQWNSLSWGSKSSMVSTKLYNKTKELQEAKSEKPYIRTAWMLTGLVDNPVSLTKRMPDGTLKKVEVWRLEFSMRSACDGWIVIEMEHGKKVKKQHIPHRLSLFDAKDKLWQRFQDLCYHYFRFKYKEYASAPDGADAVGTVSPHSEADRPLKRKDRCRDKKLWYFDAGHQFTQLSQAPCDSKTSRDLDILERRLRQYQMSHSQPDIRKACEIILKEIDLTKLVNYSPKHLWKEARALQVTLANKLNGDTRSVAEILDEVLKLINEDSIF